VHPPFRHDFGKCGHEHDPARLDLDDASLTENTRASYPLSHVPNIVPSGAAGHPRTVIFLTADAFGVIPPIARLTEDQAMYHFISDTRPRWQGRKRE